MLRRAGLALALTGCLAACGGGDEAEKSAEATPSPTPTPTTVIIATPKQVTKAVGYITAACQFYVEFAPLEYRKRARIRRMMRLLEVTAQVNPNAPSEDPGYTVKDALYDIADKMEGCDTGLEAELANIIEDL